jgi:hypothetical protein
MEKLIITTILLVVVPLMSYLIYQEMVFIKNCQIIAGKVTYLKTSRGNKGGVTYAPDITVTLPNGQQEIYSHETYSKPSSFDMGQMVPMGYYNGKLKIMYFMNRLGLSLILFLICLSLVIYIVGRITFEKFVADKITVQLNIEK